MSQTSVFSYSEFHKQKLQLFNHRRINTDCSNKISNSVHQWIISQGQGQSNYVLS